MDGISSLQLHVWHIWLIAAVIVLTGEILVPGFFFVCIAFACSLGGLAAFAGLGLTLQIIAFVLGVILALAVLRPILLRLFSHHGLPKLTNTYALTDKPAVVIRGLSSMSPGSVRVGAEEWRALPAGDHQSSPGDTVMVLRVEGSTVYVSENTNPKTKE